MKGLKQESDNAAAAAQQEQNANMEKSMSEAVKNYAAAGETISGMI